MTPTETIEAASNLLGEQFGGREELRDGRRGICFWADCGSAPEALLFWIDATGQNNRLALCRYHMSAPLDGRP